jgi:methylmalonyl-CoA mutase N-terminal domain/subunit
VGVNDFEIEEPPIEILKIDPALEKKQLERLSALKARRDAGVVSRELGRLREAATGTANVFPHLLACARAYATLGEMMDVFREVYGEYTEEATF